MLASAKPAPAAIVLTGSDAIAEEMYFHLGKARRSSSADLLS